MTVNDLLNPEMTKEAMGPRFRPNYDDPNMAQAFEIGETDRAYGKRVNRHEKDLAGANKDYTSARKKLILNSSIGGDGLRYGRNLISPPLAMRNFHKKRTERAENIDTTRPRGLRGILTDLDPTPKRMSDNMRRFKETRNATAPTIAAPKASRDYLLDNIIGPPEPTIMQKIKRSIKGL